MTRHVSTCPQAHEPDARCTCEEDLDAMIEKSSREANRIRVSPGQAAAQIRGGTGTSPADLIRQAKAQGLIKGVATYAESSRAG